jgi:hypothetical protein
MRAILEDVRSGEVAGHEVPQPELRPGGLLVRTAFSAISAGTELAHREQVEKSLLGKAMARPDLVHQVFDLDPDRWRESGLPAGAIAAGFTCPSPFLMVGYHRRFAPLTEKLQRFFAGRVEPGVVHIRMNAGYLPHQRWAQKNTSGGAASLASSAILWTGHAACWAPAW